MKAITLPLNRSRRKSQPSKRSDWVSYLIGAAVIGLMFPFGWLLQAVGGQSNWLPVNLHSVLAADYSADLRTVNLPPIQLGLIADILNDSATQTPGRFATLEGNLTTPVPTVTPRPGFPTSTIPPSPTPPATPTPRPGLAVTATQLPATVTPIPSQASSLTPTLTPALIVTNTPVVSTPFATSTRPPTQWVSPTARPSGTPLPAPTNTLHPPTSTLPPPTATLPPPTPTPRPRPTHTPVSYPGPTSPPYP
jgi:hypothetical protein